MKKKKMEILYRLTDRMAGKLHQTYHETVLILQPLCTAYHFGNQFLIQFIYTNLTWMCYLATDGSLSNLKPMLLTNYT